MFATSDVGKVPWGLAALCVMLLGSHAGLAAFNRGIHGVSPVMAPPPGDLSRKALAFGDDQFLYRRMAISLQNAGDGGGRVTPIGKYNYDYVLGWLNNLALLDPDGAHHFILAGRYFSFTQNKADIRRLVDFLAKNAVSNPRRHWYWLAQAIELADHRVGDTNRALEIARVVATYDFPGVPAWVWMFPALLLEKLGRFAEAYDTIEKVRAEKLSRLTPEEINWLNEVSQRLKTERE